MTEKLQIRMIRMKMEFNHELGKWISIWTEEQRDALQGSDQAVGVELMGKGTFEVTFDNDSLECWVTMTLDRLEGKCPLCGNDDTKYEEVQYTELRVTEPDTIVRHYECNECHHTWDGDHVCNVEECGEL